MQMRDSEVVASIVAGDPDGLAAAYDRYADPLYKYCRSMLSDPADAADAVQDTFVIAASRLAELRDPELLRAWLYAVARNECLRTLRSRKQASPIDQAPDVAATVVDLGEAAQRAELRSLLTAATAGLNPGEREILELQLRQGLESAEVAAVLGVSRNHAHSLLSRTREQLEACLAVLLVGRAGRGECGELSGMLAGWDGRLTVLLRKRVHRHIERCATCTARRAFELRPAMLLDLSAGAAMAAAVAESFRLAPSAPAGLKAHTIALATGHDAGAVAQRAAAANRGGPFGREGFPAPLHHPAAKAGLRSSRRGQAAVAAAVVAAIAVAAVAFALSGGSGRSTLAGGTSATSVPPGAGAAVDPATTASHDPSSPAATSTAAGPKPTAAKTPTTAPGATSTRATDPPVTPATSGAASPTAPASSTASTPAAQPTLSVSVQGSGLPLQPGAQVTVGLFGTRISVTAVGGPVTWSVSVSGATGNSVAVLGPSSGTLAAGASASVLIVARKQVSGAALTVSPGDATYPLVISLRL
jgi:RNA polymerase sigma factor (sigma-70 family)